MINNSKKRGRSLRIVTQMVKKLSGLVPFLKNPAASLFVMIFMFVGFGF
jgi:hypothetical protein